MKGTANAAKNVVGTHIYKYLNIRMFNLSCNDTSFDDCQACDEPGYLVTT